MTKVNRMGREEFLHEIRRRGYSAKWHVLRHCIEAEHVPQPERDEHGNRVYTQSHVAAFIKYLKAHRPRVQEPALMD